MINKITLITELINSVKKVSPEVKNWVTLTPKEKKKIEKIRHKLMCKAKITRALHLSISKKYENTIKAINYMLKYSCVCRDAI